MMALLLDTDETDHNRAGAKGPDARRTVLKIVPALDTGGAERTTVDIANALNKEGWAALVASRGGRLAHELRDNGGELIRMDAASKNIRTILANAGRFVQLIRERNISLVHA